MATLEQKKESLSDFLANNSQDAQAPQVPADPTIPQVQAQSPNPQQALSTVQPPQTNQVPSGLQGMFGKDAPESMESSMLRGMFQQSPTIQPQIQPFQDNVSPARSLLTNFVNGLTAGTMGQRFFTTRAQRYKEWYDLQNLRLQQQQRDQQMQLGQMKVIQQALKQQSVDQYHNDLNKIRSTKDAAQQAYLQQQFQAKYGTGGLSWQQLDLANRKYEAMQRHLNNQDQLAEDKQGPIAQALKDPVYARNMAMLEQQFQSQGLDPNDPKVQPTFLAQLENATLAEHQKLAAMKGQQNPPRALMVGPDGKAYEVTPGTQVIPGSQTPQGVNTMNTPTMATRRAGEQGQIIQNMGDYLISQIENNRDIFGNLPAYWKKAMNNSPVSDPRAARLISEIQSFAALQPALHGFRSSQAMEEFEKSIGGISKNPDALIQAIKGIQQTGGIVHLVGEGKGNTSTAPKVGDSFQGSKIKSVKVIK